MNTLKMRRPQWTRRWWWRARRWPVVRRETAERMKADALHAAHRRHEKELAEVTEQAQKIISAARTFRWDELAQGQYRFTLTLSPEIVRMHGMHDQHGLDLLARLFAREVEREIRSSKFLEEAHDRRREYMRDTRAYPSEYRSSGWDATAEGRDG